MPVSTKGKIVVEGHELIITNPDKPLWPDVGITKLTYLQKLIVLSPYLLKYCRNRYLTTIRYPHGVGDKSFYQKNAPQPTPEFVRIESKQHPLLYCGQSSRHCYGSPIWLVLSFIHHSITWTVSFPQNG